MQRRNLRQAELGRLIDVTPSAVSLWMKDQTKPSRETTIRLEDVLGLSRGELLEMLGYASDERGQRLITLEEAIRSDEGISPEHKRALLVFVKAAREEASASEPI